jgi:hypothetical protein
VLLHETIQYILQLTIDIFGELCVCNIDHMTLFYWEKEPRFTIHIVYVYI